GAAAVTAVLTDPACRVRPAAEPVPKALLGSPAAAVYRRLVRGNDGAAHGPAKQGVAAAFDALDGDPVARGGRRWAGLLASGIGRVTDPSRLTEFVFALPAYVVGSLLGVADEELPAVARRAGEFVRCLFPGGDAGQVEQGKAAAAWLFDRFHSQVQSA